MRPHRKQFLTAILMSLLLFAACGKKYVAHPGSLSSFDSKAYDALIMWNGVLAQAKSDLYIGKIPANSRTLINKTGEVYNSARSAWIAYRAAVRAANSTDAVAAQADFNRFQSQIESLIDQLTQLLLASGGKAERPIVAGDPPPFLTLERSTR